MRRVHVRPKITLEDCFVAERDSLAYIILRMATYSLASNFWNLVDCFLTKRCSVTCNTKKWVASHVF